MCSSLRCLSNQMNLVRCSLSLIESQVSAGEWAEAYFDIQAAPMEVDHGCRANDRMIARGTREPALNKKDDWYTEMS